MKKLKTKLFFQEFKLFFEWMKEEEVVPENITLLELKRKTHYLKIKCQENVEKNG